ncbi:MAG: sugar phosphate isomerase/epimerase [Armatimonadetes bacterium]|nr:sugar phosphate isomerase/epimerase [Armatimonadota bacterium]
MENLLACNLGSYRQYVETAYAHLPSIGVRHIEIGLPKPEEVGGILKKLEPYGLAVSSVLARFDIANERAAAEFAPALETARALGAGVVFISVHAGELPRPVVYERLRRAGDAAREKGLTIAMETHPDLATNGTVALETMEGIAHPNVGVNFDTANIYYYNEGTDAVTELQKIARYVVSVHLKDTNGKPKTWYFPTLGEGVVDYKSVFTLMNAEGMRGPFTMEMEGIEGEALTLEETHARMAESVAYLRGLGVIG